MQTFSQIFDSSKMESDLNSVESNSPQDLNKAIIDLFFQGVKDWREEDSDGLQGDQDIGEIWAVYKTSLPEKYSSAAESLEGIVFPREITLGDSCTLDEALKAVFLLSIPHVLYNHSLDFHPVTSRLNSFCDNIALSRKADENVFCVVAKKNVKRNEALLEHNIYDYRDYMPELCVQYDRDHIAHYAIKYVDNFISKLGILLEDLEVRLAFQASSSKSQAAFIQIIYMFYTRMLSYRVLSDLGDNDESYYRFFAHTESIYHLTSGLSSIRLSVDSLVGQCRELMLFNLSLLVAPALTPQEISRQRAICILSKARADYYADKNTSSIPYELSDAKFTRLKAMHSDHTLPLEMFVPNDDYKLDNGHYFFSLDEAAGVQAACNAFYNLSLSFMGRRNLDPHLGVATLYRLFDFVMICNQTPQWIKNRQEEIKGQLNYEPYLIIYDATEGRNLKTLQALIAYLFKTPSPLRKSFLSFFTLSENSVVETLKRQVAASPCMKTLLGALYQFAVSTNEPRDSELGGSVRQMLQECFKDRDLTQVEGDLLIANFSEMLNSQSCNLPNRAN